MGPFEDQRTNEIKVTDMCFSPTVARIDVGDTVTFFNGQTQHMVGGMAGSFGDLHTELAAGKKLSYRFDEEGVFPYACILHPGMGGAIVVGDGEGKVASGGVIQVARSISSDDTSSSEARSTDAAPSAAEEESSWLLPVAAGLVFLTLASVLAWKRGLIPGLGRDLSGSRSASAHNVS